MARLYKRAASSGEVEPLIAAARSDARATAGKLEPERTRWTKPAFLAMAFLALFFLLRLVLSLAAPMDQEQSGIKPITPQIPIPDSIKHDWGPYTPYFSVSEYLQPPNGCRITQVNLVSISCF